MTCSHWEIQNVVILMASLRFNVIKDNVNYLLIETTTKICCYKKQIEKASGGRNEFLAGGWTFLLFSLLWNISVLYFFNLSFQLSVYDFWLCYCLVYCTVDKLSVFIVSHVHNWRRLTQVLQFNDFNNTVHLMQEERHLIIYRWLEHS